MLYQRSCPEIIGRVSAAFADNLVLIQALRLSDGVFGGMDRYIYMEGFVELFHEKMEFLPVSFPIRKARVEHFMAHDISEALYISIEKEMPAEGHGADVIFPPLHAAGAVYPDARGDMDSLGTAH